MDEQQKPFSEGIQSLTLMSSRMRGNFPPGVVTPPRVVVWLCFGENTC